MNPSIKKLADTASKNTKVIIGLMSGTSLDGLDIALAQISDSGSKTSIELKNFITRPYNTKTQKRLQAISSVPEASMEEICLIHSWLGNQHGKFVLEALDKWGIDPSDVDCIASHGQTIYHAPRIQHEQEDMPNATLQIGDGDHIAHTTGILTISDFRQKHTAAGGEGAPMVSFVDRVLYRDDSEERILLNIGGIANFTYLPPKSSSRSSVTTDTGPGNTLIDAVAQEYFAHSFDRNGKIARQGSVDESGLKALKSDPYFQQPLPKTTGLEVFNLEWVNNQLEKADIIDVSPEDLIATLTRLTAETIADCVLEILSDNEEGAIYISGGGLHNPVLVEWVRELIPNVQIKNFDTIGFNPDAKEAVLFAVLANELLSGEGFRINPEEKLNFGKISFPD